MLISLLMLDNYIFTCAEWSCDDANDAYDAYIWSLVVNISTKLDDENDAGGKNSEKCTLILTEGDSAKALDVSAFK